MKVNYICAAKAIPTPAGMFAIFNYDPEQIRPILEDEWAREYSLEATEFGLMVLIPKAGLQVPLPTPMFDYLLEVPNIVLLFAKAEDYIPKPLCTITLDIEAIKKAKEILVF